MADTFPKFIVIKSLPSGDYLYYMTDDDVRGHVRCKEQSVFGTYAKIEVEPAKISRKFVHLRFCSSNKYWARRGPGEDDRWIVASSDQREEDTSKLTCTLFEPHFEKGLLYLTHVQSGGSVRNDFEHGGRMGSWVYVHEEVQGRSAGFDFSYVDWDTLVQLPKRVAFRVNNGGFLKATWYDDKYPYLQFSSSDGNERASAQEVHLHPDGHVLIKSEEFGKFWRNSGNWIKADSSDDSGRDGNTLFWPVKVDDRTIALRSKGNNLFCKRLSLDGKTNCLNANVSNITDEAKLVVEELVLERSIYNVRYRMEDARIFDEKPFLAGIGAASNESNEESSLSIKVAYEDTSSSYFSNSLSITVGVAATMEAGVPGILDGKIKVSAEVTTAFEWQKTKVEKKTVEATYTLKVPPRSRAKINYVGKHGKCSVPFSYTQRDKSSSDGHFITSQHIDGLFTGVNYYSFNFEELAIEPL